MNHQQLNANETLKVEREVANELFVQHYDVYLRTAYKILRSREDSEDAVQTAYCAAFRNLHAFRGEASFKSWVTRIVVNCCLAQLRQRRTRPSVGFDDVGVLPILESQTITPEVLCSSKKLRRVHAIAASRLPEALRDVYIPYAISGVALAEVTRRLGLTTPAAKARLFRARVKVERSLQPLAQRRAA